MGVFAAPSMAASPAWDAAVALSAQDSKATLADLCNAVYKAAKENPEKYEYLVVRVGGYSARFVHLNPAIQDEIINRMRHAR